MPQTPKTFNKQSLEDPKRLAEEMDRMFRYLRADIEKLEQRAAAAEARLTVLETI